MQDTWFIDSVLVLPSILFFSPCDYPTRFWKFSTNSNLPMWLIPGGGGYWNGLQPPHTEVVIDTRNTIVNYIAYGVNRSGSVWARFTNCVNWCTLDKFTWELLYFNFAKLSTTFSASKCMAISWCSLSFEHYLLLPELSILIKVIRMNECYQNIFLGLVPRLALL